jgi:hypothetical protein
MPRDGLWARRGPWGAPLAVVVLAMLAHAPAARAQCYPSKFRG